MKNLLGKMTKTLLPLIGLIVSQISKSVHLYSLIIKIPSGKKHSAKTWIQPKLYNR